MSPAPGDARAGVRTLALEPIGGIAGDMLLAALLHLGAPRAALDHGLSVLAEAAGDLDLRSVKVISRPAEVAGIRCLHVDIQAPGEGHQHRPFRVIRDLLRRAALPPRARELSLQAFTLLAEAEGRVHGVVPEQVEFHEVGALDSIADVVGNALLLDALRLDRIVALAPPSGGGTARSAHGMIPLPAPATLELLRGRSLRPSGPGERTTPTGAALLAAWTEPALALPELSIEAIGYGAGTSRWDDAPNVLRAVLGTSVPQVEGAFVIEANLDDLSPQLAAVALEAALQAGALDAWIAPLTMKKGRPGHLLGALVPESAREAVQAALFQETTTLGVRSHRVERSVLERELVEVQTAYGPVRMKLGRQGTRLVNVAPEFEDCAHAAREHGVAVKEVMAAAVAAFRMSPR